jgi:arsenate reductase
MMSRSFLIHNPRCGKSRGAKEILEGKGIEFETVEYLKDGLTEEILLQLPKLLKLNYPDMIRSKEEIYQTLKLADKILSTSDWITILKQHPILLERPIFVHHGRGVIARPSEKVLEVLVSN